jgi:hypothetical protein
MIMFGSFLPSLLVGFGTTKVYSGVGADIVMESITLKTHSMNEMAWLRQLSKNKTGADHSAPG